MALRKRHDSNGYVNARTNFNNHTTNFTKNAFTGSLLTATFPSTPGDTPPNTPRGVVTYTYGSASCSDPNNRDSNNPYYVCTATDEGGHTTTYTRDTAKRITQIAFPDGGSESFQCNSFGQVTSHTMRTGGVETVTYDGRGLPQNYRDPYHATGNPTAWYQYDSIDRISGITDTLGSGPGDVNHTTNFAYNSRGDINVTTLPVDPNDGQRHTVTKGYNLANGTVASVTDPLNHTTSVVYDDYKRPLTTTTPPRFSGDTMNHTASVYYDANGTGNDYTHTDSNPTWLVSPSGKIVTNVYDGNRRKISMTVGACAYSGGGGGGLGSPTPTPPPSCPDAATTTFGYDLNGNLTSVVAPKEQPGQAFAGQSVVTVYDERNRPYSVTDPLGNVTSCKYDAAGRKASVTRANGQVVTFDSFDAMNRLLQSTVKQTPDPDAVTKYTYYTSGLLATMKDPRLVAINSSETYTYQYDSMGRKLSLTYPRPTPSATPTSESWHYDTAGRIDTCTNRNGNTQRILYDNLNRAYNIAWDDSGLTPTVTLNYDAASRVTAINDANANISHAFFDDNLLSSETDTYADGVARSINYTYDADANRASIQYPANAYSFTYDYTGRNQPWHILNNNTPIVTNVYDPDGKLTSSAPDNSTTSSFIYDGLDRLIHISHALNGTTRTFDYGYDSVSNRKWTKRDGANGDVFGYDLADQSTSILLNVANPDTTSPGAQTINYDANGNRNTFSAYGPTDAYTTNNLNQYTQRDSSTATYDTKGNMTIGFDGSLYTYDARSRILTASKGGTTDTFKYDGLNRQVSRQIGAAQPVYNVYDGWNLIGEYAPGATSPTVAYLGGLKNLSANLYFYHDGSESTSHLADNTGTLLESYRYDLQGTPTFYDGSGMQISATQHNVRNLFTGQQWYSEIGLYDLRNRFYSPDIGRFLQADPLGFGGGDNNLYRYCSNNPVVYEDPAGLWQISIFAGDGLAVNVTFGYNSGQWNFGALGGIGVGYSASIDLADSGLHQEGMFGTAAATGGLSNGVSGADLDLRVDSSGEKSFTVMGNVAGVNGGVTFHNNGGPTLAWGGSLGGGGFLGGGYQDYGPAPTNPDNSDPNWRVWVTATFPLNSYGDPQWGGGTMAEVGPAMSTPGISAGEGWVDLGGGEGVTQGTSMDPFSQMGSAVGGIWSLGGGPLDHGDPAFIGVPVSANTLPQYATGWTWVHDPMSSYGRGGPGQHGGWWAPTGWTTDPALAVPMPFRRGHIGKK